MTILRMLDGTTRDGSTVVVTVGRSMTGRTVIMVGSTAAELDTSETLGLIIGAGEVLRASGVEWGGQR